MDQIDRTKPSETPGTGGIAGGSLIGTNSKKNTGRFWRLPGGNCRESEEVKHSRCVKNPLSVC